MVLQEHDEVAAEIGELLGGRDERVAVAETTAGGLITARLLSVPRASRWLDRGIVAYTSAAKRDSLGADMDVLKEHGAVSEEAVLAMADGLRKVAEVAWVLSESGLAGPIRGRSAKPVGSVSFAVVGPNSRTCEGMLFDGNRVRIMEQIAEHALQMLKRELSA